MSSLLCVAGQGAAVGARSAGADGHQDGADAVHKARPPWGGALRGALKAAGEADVFPNSSSLRHRGSAPEGTSTASMQTDEPRLTEGRVAGIPGRRGSL